MVLARGGRHDGSESRCEIVRARKFNDVAGGGLTKWERREAGSASKFERWREVSQARGFAAQGRKTLGKIVQGHER
jgi:hypothetical protein